MTTPTAKPRRGRAAGGLRPVPSIEPALADTPATMQFFGARSVRTLENWVRDGRIMAPLKIGNKNYWKLDALRLLVACDMDMSRYRLALAAQAKGAK